MGHRKLQYQCVVRTFVSGTKMTKKIKQYLEKTYKAVRMCKIK